VRPTLVSIEISASPAVVWDYVKDISRHPEWMRDAVAIRFTSHTTQGVGTTFDCDTRVGPFRLTDTMTVTDWLDGKTRYPSRGHGHRAWQLHPRADRGGRHAVRMA
jgi:hypothetical protein